MRKHFLNWQHCVFATVWIINGLFCKVMNLAPRHQEIVAKILGSEHARLLTFLIGVAEIGMAVWILSGIQKRLNALTQIFVIAIMNALEFFLAPDLLLWGRVNVFFAFVFILLIYYNEFHYTKNLTEKQDAFIFKKSSFRC